MAAKAAETEVVTMEKAAGKESFELKAFLKNHGYQFVNPNLWFIIGIISFISALVMDADRHILIKFATTAGWFSIILQFVGQNMKATGTKFPF